MCPRQQQLRPVRNIGTAQILPRPTISRPKGAHSIIQLAADYEREIRREELFENTDQDKAATLVGRIRKVFMRLIKRLGTITTEHVLVAASFLIALCASGNAIISALGIH